MSEEKKQRLNKYQKIIVKQIKVKRLETVYLIMYAILLTFNPNIVQPFFGYTLLNPWYY